MKENKRREEENRKKQVEEHRKQMIAFFNNPNVKSEIQNMSPEEVEKLWACLLDSDCFDRLVANGRSQQSRVIPPVVPVPGGMSTGRTQPRNLKEQLAMEQAKSNPTAGKELPKPQMTDPRWPASKGWMKMAQNINGVEIHYVRNTITGEVADFKFID